ncbi:acetyl/propionyl/methylcrotonyl-CoA carboxylase subunit alpha [Oceanibaculum indicum]|uniref:3-methylcrotonyl-CoA carboxylase alpha subunit n=1 Tax=Oceanibaculum indicum TaxID=526216 RepID=A0A420WI47_9PROT|nr:acetyl/propionyl/methylcrotonyl-CoA carboxylase subunit alpha [Oceanibaculum indicum]RKQ70691.1 3-methylcrotonyl-CoA carboxylase alpha subunit [Oceanibaculum indicum]
MTIRTLLIANRGEIACRIARTARRLGIRTIAVYSEADAGSLHVESCDEAWPIGAAPARDSYLRGDVILDVAKRAGADAIHPGYGFLSENAEFARACAEAGILFVGPPASAIEAMGSKSAAKQLMEKARVPLVPGYHGDKQEPAFLERQANRIGYPVLIKASAGGGGKGMKVVEQPADFAAQLASAKREASASFGDDKVLIEKYLVRPRHVEIQIFADGHGNCLHLFERDCSVQRRHQKVIEEAPAPGMTGDRRREMGDAAVAAARAISYVGAGTVEFIVDAAGDFFFMEMNTRLQVEHPVTEAITGLDLVEWQLRVASGEPLPLAQDQLRINGHAFEARLYAEDPARDFVPQTGRLAALRFPTDGVRIDTGVREGDSVSVHYDPMIAKLIVHGADRTEALDRLSRALEATRVAGLATNIGFLAALARHPAFAAGDVHTGFIAEHEADLLPPAQPAGDIHLALAALAFMAARTREAREAATRSGDPFSPWHRVDGWRLNDDAHHRLAFRDGEAERVVTLHFRRDGFVLDLPGGSMPAQLLAEEDGLLTVLLDGVRREAVVARDGLDYWVLPGAGQPDRRLSLIDPVLEAEAMAEGAGARFTAPMPGKIVQVLIEAGARVAKGAALIVMEAMKMEHTIAAPADGTVAELHYGTGDLVEEGAELLRFEPGKG